MQYKINPNAILFIILGSIAALALSGIQAWGWFCFAMAILTFICEIKD